MLSIWQKVAYITPFLCLLYACTEPITNSNVVDTTEDQLIFSNMILDQNTLEFAIPLERDFGVINPCDPNPCMIGMSCEVVTQMDGTMVAQCDRQADCDLVTCADHEECVIDDSGAYCQMVICTSDQDCLDQSYCDLNQQQCVMDQCAAGSRHCMEETLYQCNLNGSEEVALVQCGDRSSCIEADMDGVTTAFCSCIDDWDCPGEGFNRCEEGQCIGVGMTERCQLPPVAFDESLPIAEIQWGSGTEVLNNNNVMDYEHIPFALSTQVVTTPMVANLDDDNGDGKIDEKDYPEIIFISFCNGSFQNNGMLRAIHGGGPKKGQDYFAILGTQVWHEGDPIPATSDYRCGQAELNSTATLAVGDLDPISNLEENNQLGSPGPEIVAVHESKGIIVFAHNGNILTQGLIGTLEIENNDNPAVALANLDAQGPAEVIIGSVVVTFQYDAAGQLQIKDQFKGKQSEGVNGLGPISCVADINQDQQLEVIAGGSVYQLPQAPMGAETAEDCVINGGNIEAQNPSQEAWCQRQLHLLWDTRQVNGMQAQTEGFCAVADILGVDQDQSPSATNPLDGQAELILIRNGGVQIFNGQNGVLKRDLPQRLGANGGAPNIGDFDGDGFPEIGSAFANGYAMIDLQDSTDICPAWPDVMADQDMPPLARVNGQACQQDMDCGAGALCKDEMCICLHNGWRRETEDGSSRATGSTLFDFNGDGSVEVVYNDECWFRIYDGRTGQVLLKEASESRTRIENPIVADVDLDGNAEIVFSTTTESTFCSERNQSNPQTNQQWKESYNAGIEVWGDPNDRWVPARRIWNQHSYHITHIREDATIPSMPQTAWSLGIDYNTYRAQPSSQGVAPDLQIISASVNASAGGCGLAEGAIEIRALVSNQGEVILGADIPIAFEGLWDGNWRALQHNGEVLVTHLGASLAPGLQRFIRMSYDAQLDTEAQGVRPERMRVIADPVSPEYPFGSERECREDNNQREIDLQQTSPLADLSIALESIDDSQCPYILLRVQVSNQGERDAVANELALYAGDPTQGGVSIARYPIPALARGESETIEIESPALPTDREITFFMAVDPSNQIAECNEDNTIQAAQSVLCRLQDGF